MAGTAFYPSLPVPKPPAALRVSLHPHGAMHDRYRFRLLNTGVLPAVSRYVACWSPLLLLPVLAGCSIRPDAGPPGTVYYQRHRAVVHDPFPSRTIGPEIEGVRPMEYDRPLAEPLLHQTNPHAKPGGFGF